MRGERDRLRASRALLFGRNVVDPKGATNSLLSMQRITDTKKEDRCFVSFRLSLVPPSSSSATESDSDTSGKIEFITDFGESSSMGKKSQSSKRTPAQHAEDSDDDEDRPTTKPLMQGPQVEPSAEMLEAAARERRRKERQLRLSVIVSIYWSGTSENRKSFYICRLFYYRTFSNVIFGFCRKEARRDSLSPLRAGNGSSLHRDRRRRSRSSDRQWRRLVHVC